MADWDVIEVEGPYFTLSEDKRSVHFNLGPYLRLKYAQTVKLDGHLLLQFDKDGRFFLGEGVETDEAARVFWSTVRQYAEADRQQAVLEERERCAKVAEKMGGFGVADAIREG